MATEFSGSERERLTRLERAVFGNGRPGLVDRFSEHASDFRSFRDVWENREKDKMVYDDRQARRSNTILTAAGVLIALGAAIISLLLYEHETHQSVLKPPTAIHHTLAVETGAHVHPR